jgi:hypothetical protein
VKQISLESTSESTGIRERNVAEIMADILSSTPPPPAAAAPQPSSKKRESLESLESLDDVKAAPKNFRVPSTNTNVRWTEEMHNLVMTLVGEKQRRNGTVSMSVWDQIAQDMSAKEWPSSGGGTQKHSFTSKSCQRRYTRHKGAFIVPKNVKWTTETHLHLLVLVKERKDEDGAVSGWKQIAQDMSTKEWTSSGGDTYTLNFTSAACQRRYNVVER